MLLRQMTVCVGLGVIFALAAPGLHPQQTETASSSQNAGPPTFTVHAQLVNLPVVVRTRSGALVTTLNKDDFDLSIDGRQPHTVL